MTDKTQRKIESRKVALIDLQAVSEIARLLVETPPVNVGRLSIYDQPYLAQTLETGLVVTYARVFTNSQLYTPVPPSWISSEHEALHAELIARRNQYHAHIDRAPTNLHGRKIADGPRPGWFAVGFPDLLTSAQLEELAELARKVHRLVADDIERLEN